MDHVYFELMVKFITVSDLYCQNQTRDPNLLSKWDLDPDTENEIANRIRAVNKEDPESADLDPEIVDSLIKMLDQYNPIVKEFRHARDILREHEGVDVSIRIVGTDS